MTDGSVQVGEIEVSGRTFTVFASIGGTWRVDFDGKQIASATLEDLRKRLMQATKTSRLSLDIRYVTLAGERARIYGVHGGTGNLLAEIEGNKEQLSGYGGGEALADLSDEELRVYRSLLDTQVRAVAQTKAFRDERKLNLREEVAKANTDG